MTILGMISVCYTGTATDYSGYGNANRMDITSLFIAGINLTTEIIRQVPEKVDYGLTEAIAIKLQDRKINYRIKIIHLTPDLYPQYMEKGKYHIGRLFFETDKLPKEWIEPCNQLDEIWTSTPQQEEMIKRSGVKTPIYLFSQAIDTSKAYETIEPFKLEEKKDFIFYSVFQFILRKNPRGLLRAYWQEFSGNDDVTLLIKTYGVSYLDKEYERIKQEIVQWKKELNLKHYPKVYLVHKLLTDDGMSKFHKLGDVYVNPSASEGWGRPIQEAMLYGNPVITPTCGITDLMTSQYYYKVDSKLVQATQQSWIAWYTPDMQWKELDEDSLRKRMREVFEDNKPNLKAQQYVVGHFSFQTIGAQMKQRLEAISKTLD